MKKLLRKLLNISLLTVYIISHSILIWIFLSTVEIISTNTIRNKINDYNIFVLSNTLKEKSKTNKIYIYYFIDKNNSEYEEDDEFESNEYENICEC